MMIFRYLTIDSYLGQEDSCDCEVFSRHVFRRRLTKSVLMLSLLLVTAGPLI